MTTTTVLEAGILLDVIEPGRCPDCGHQFHAECGCDCCGPYINAGEK